MKWKIKTMFETTNQMRNENAKNHMEKIEIVADLQLLGTLVTCLYRNITCLSILCIVYYSMVCTYNFDTLK